MANKMINVNITQSPNGTFGATVAEFPEIKVENARDLDELRQAVEIAISVDQAKGGPRTPVKLPPFVIGQVTRL